MENVPWTYLSAFVRSGSVIPMAPSGLQYTDALPGGALEVWCYGGAAGAFTLTEDDGETTGYKDRKTRIIKLMWNEAAQELCWNLAIACFQDARSFKTIKLV